MKRSSVSAFLLAIVLSALRPVHADDVVLVDNLRFNGAPFEGHFITIDGRATGHGANLQLRPGSTQDPLGQGGHFDLFAGTGPLGPGSLGFARAPFGAHIITVGCCSEDQPGVTTQLHARARDVYFTGIEDLQLLTKTGDIISDSKNATSLRVNGQQRIGLSSGNTSLWYSGQSEVSLNAAGLHLGRATGRISFFGASPQDQPVITGSRSDGSACTALIYNLGRLGLIVDQTTP